MSGFVVNVKPTSMSMDKGYPSNNVWTDSVEIQYEGVLSLFDKNLCSYGVDERTGSGSQVLLIIEFSEDPQHDRPKDCKFQSIGWVEINPVSYTRPGEELLNPVFINMRLSLKKTDFQDFLIFGNNMIRIEIHFNWDDDGKFLTYKSGQLVQFDISRIKFEPILIDE
jgi:hypothetical protein